MLSASQLRTLRYSHDGAPTVRLTTKASLVPKSLILSQDGSPWYGLALPTTYTLTIDTAQLELSAGNIGLFYNQAKPINIIPPYIVVYMWKRTL